MRVKSIRPETRSCPHLCTCVQTNATKLQQHGPGRQGSSLHASSKQGVLPGHHESAPARDAQPGMSSSKHGSARQRTILWTILKTGLVRGAGARGEGCDAPSE